MKANMGSTDKMIRILIALICIALYAFDVVSGTAGVVVLVVAALMVLTSLVSFCPLYPILGINTCKKQG